MNPVNEYFDAVFCINLRERAERRRHCEQLFAHLKWQVEFIDAFDGRAIETNGVMTGGTVGNSISHARVLSQAMARGLRNYLVLEDDIVVRLDTNAELLRVLDGAPKDWSYLYLGWIPWCNHYEDHVDADWDHVHGMNGTHAMGVSKAVYQHYLFGLLKLVDHCDTVATKLHDSFEAYCVRKNWITQPGLFDSDAFPDKKQSGYDTSWDDYLVPPFLDLIQG